LADCNPQDYLLKDDHDRQCDQRHDAAMEWAHSAVDHSKEDRVNIWAKILHLEETISKVVHDNDLFVKKIGGYFIKGLIAIVCVMLFQVFILPKVSKNGEASMLSAIDSKQARQYKVSKTNDENIRIIMQKMGLPYKSPEDD